ncbi:MAG: site-specific DNA-methyltransferase, partial [Proteobacteria bacterium]|nr:site-specific DNA-methyltransferase [Pseudomonadota bacterium]
GHPAIYPDSLVERLIRMFSYEGDTVLDPWLGSGTTVKVARELNREAVGYEKEAQYKSVIMKKLGFQSMVEILDEVNQSIAEMDAEASDELVPTLVRRPDSELLDLSEFLDWDEGAEDELAAEEGQGEAIQSPDHSEVMTADSPA